MATDGEENKLVIPLRDENLEGIMLTPTEVIYGRDKEKRKIREWMAHQHNSESGEVQRINIVGPTGVGKTSVVQLVFNEVKADGVYDLAVWINVSSRFDPVLIAGDFLESVTSKKIDKIELQSDTIHRVHGIVKGKKYLLVLDGVKEEEIQDKWDDLMLYFKCGAAGSTILTTMRLHDHYYGSKSPPLVCTITVMNNEVCWSIIKDQAFGTNTEGDTSMIPDHIRQELASRCGGLPVIAKAIGGALHGKTELQHWQNVLASDIWWEKDEPHAMKAPKLSYGFLPSLLRKCLLCCSLFPKNQCIDVSQLLSLWMSLYMGGMEDMEAQACRWFKELLRRSIFKDYYHDRSGLFKCKLQGSMSDFIDDLAAREREEPFFRTHLEGADNSVNPPPESTQHCTLQVLPKASLDARSIGNAKRLKSLILLSEYSRVDLEKLNSLLNVVAKEELMVLDMSSCSMKEIPLKACEMKNLRYLNLSFNRYLKSLPKEICKLANLQSLNLNGCDELRELPRDIGKLIKLRHLDILFTTNLEYLPKGLTRLTELRRLSRFFGVSGFGRNACNIADLKKLNKLEGCILIEGLGGRTGAPEAIKEVLSEKKSLVGLELWFSLAGSKETDEKVLDYLKLPCNLRCLGIFYYKGSRFNYLRPAWMMELHNLTHLIIANCNNCNKLPPLGRLQSLKSLEIKNLPNVKKVGLEILWITNEDFSLQVPFRNLQTLRFRMLPRWKEWEGIDDVYGVQVMPVLSSLSIIGSPEMKEDKLPHYIKNRKEEVLIEIEISESESTKKRLQSRMFTQVGHENVQDLKS